MSSLRAAEVRFEYNEFGTGLKNRGKEVERKSGAFIEEKVSLEVQYFQFAAREEVTEP